MQRRDITVHCSPVTFYHLQRNHPLVCIEHIHTINQKFGGRKFTLNKLNNILQRIFEGIMNAKLSKKIRHWTKKTKFMKFLS